MKSYNPPPQEERAYPIILRDDKQEVEVGLETVMEMPFALVLSLELYDDCRIQVFLRSPAYCSLPPVK